VGSTEVKGVLLDQFAVEEYKGRYLIIATTTSNYAVDVTSYHIEIGEMVRGGTPTNMTILTIMVCYPQMSRCEHIKVAIPPYIGSIAQVLPPIRLIAYPVITQLIPVTQST
jgi:hypothetical protein